jgi:PAS domain S-box-containing protein
LLGKWRTPERNRPLTGVRDCQIDMPPQDQLIPPAGELRLNLGIPVDRRADRRVGPSSGSLPAVDRRATPAAHVDTRYKFLASALTDAVWDWDLIRDQIQWSDALREAFGYAPRDMATDSQWWVDRIHPDDRGRVVQQLHEWLQGRRGRWMAEYRFRHANGTYLIVADRGTLIYDQIERPVRMVGGMADISAQHEMARQLRISQKMEAVGLLAGGVAHDFNNVLTAIMGAATLLRSTLAGKDHNPAHLDAIESAADRGARLTRQLLAFGSKQMLEPEPLDLNTVVEGLSSMLRRLIPSTIRVEQQLQTGLPPVFVDAGQVEQIIVNLVLNARDAMPDGGTLTLTTSLGAAGARTIVLEVKDSGVGMDLVTQARIFEPFFTTKQPGVGTGLGLSTVYGIVKQSGGTVTVSSAPGRGSAFRVEFPTMSEPSRVARATKPDANVALPAAKVAATILVAEDDDAVRSIIRDVLETAGHTVLTTCNGEEAVQVARTHDGPIDLLITDMMMPYKTGDVASAEVSVLRPGIGTVLMSGYSDRLIETEDTSRTIVQKPFAASELLTLVERLMQRQSHRIELFKSAESRTEGIASFVANALRHGHPAVVIVDELHRNAVAERMLAQGVDVASAVTLNRLTILDAADLLTRVMRGGMPDATLFDEAMRGYASRVEPPHRLHVYSESSDLLAAQGQLTSTLRLEELWNALIQRHGFVVMCGYALEHLDEHREALSLICGMHGHAVPGKNHSISGGREEVL